MEELFLGAVKSSCVILKVVSCAGAAIPAPMAAQCACEPSSQLSPHDIITRVMIEGLPFTKNRSYSVHVVCLL
jgi:hypothetical protein